MHYITKILFAYLLMFIFSSGVSHCQWEVIVPNGIDSNYILSKFITKGDTIISAHFSIFLSFDKGRNWIKKPLPFDSIKNEVTSIAIIGDTLFAGIYNKGIFLSTDFGTTWIERNNGIILDQGGTQSIFYLFLFEDLFFVSTQKHFYISKDRGENWILRDSSLGDDFLKYLNYFRDIAKKGNEIWLMSLSMLFHSTDGGQNWASKGRNWALIQYTKILPRDDGVLVGTKEYGVLHYNDEEEFTPRNKWLPYKSFEVISFVTYENYIFAGLTSYGSFQRNYTATLFMSTDDGRSWNRVIFDSTNRSLILLDVFLIGDTIMVPVFLQSDRIVIIYQAPIKEVIAKILQNIQNGNEMDKTEAIFDRKKGYIKNQQRGRR